MGCGKNFGEDGKWFFDVKWEGWDIHRYSARRVRYCKEKGLKVDVLAELSDVASD